MLPRRRTRWEQITKRWLGQAFSGIVCSFVLNTWRWSFLLIRLGYPTLVQPQDELTCSKSRCRRTFVGLWKGHYNWRKGQTMKQRTYHDSVSSKYKMKRVTQTNPSPRRLTSIWPGPVFKEWDYGWFTPSWCFTRPDFLKRVCVTYVMDPLNSNCLKICAQAYRSLYLQSTGLAFIKSLLNKFKIFKRRKIKVGVFARACVSLCVNSLILVKGLWGFVNIKWNHFISQEFFKRLFIMMNIYCVDSERKKKKD